MIVLLQAKLNAKVTILKPADTLMQILAWVGKLQPVTMIYLQQKTYALEANAFSQRDAQEVMPIGMVRSVFVIQAMQAAAMIQQMQMVVKPLLEALQAASHIMTALMMEIPAHKSNALDLEAPASM